MAKNVAVSPRLWQNSAALESSQRCAWGKQEAKGIAKVRGVTGFLWWVRSSFDLPSEVGGGPSQVCRSEVTQN